MPSIREADRALVGTVFAQPCSRSLAFPLQGITTIALVLGILFIIEGVMRCLLYFQTHSRALILLIDGIIGIVFGIIIVAIVPDDAAFIIALLVGFRLIMAGVVLFMVGRVIEDTAITE
ncbi:DUF308 domain-containing protein [Stieleria magnilauensis]|uniref:Acid-resistance membrane protein n=1 Tax=Stieleria magnilauensis TaxID=2527963 RepID=A0ABX5XUM6_9BACT|nr:acid-resistance membrane protein [Planctomycetes bacterium TBK1r]